MPNLTMLNKTLKLKINNISNRLTFTCRNCIYPSVMFFLYCTEIAMFRFRGRSGISDYKKLFYAILLLKRLFSCIFWSIAYILLYSL